MDWKDVSQYALKFAQVEARTLQGRERDVDFNAEDLYEEFALVWIALQPKLDPDATRKECLAMFRQKMHWCVRDMLRRRNRRRELVGVKVDVDLSMFSGPDRVREHEVLLAFERAADRAPEPLKRFLVDVLGGGSMTRDGETKRQAIKRLTGWSSPTFYRHLNAWRDNHLMPALT